MSDLQVVLITLGAMIIAGVVVYNWMQERKMRRNITDDFLVPQKDVLTEDFYIDADAYVDKALADIPNKAKLTEKLNAIDQEPAMVKAGISGNHDTEPDELLSQELAGESQEVIDLSAVEVSTPAQEQSKEHTSIKSVPVRATPMNTEADEEFDITPLPNEIHPQIDLTAFLYATKFINAQTINTMAENIASDMGVPMMVHGIDKDGKWHSTKRTPSGDSFKQIACSIQLADRGGPISKHMLNKFQFAIENMGLELGAHVEWQGAGDAMQRAIDLDKFCMEVDQLISVHLAVGDIPVHGTKFRGLAEACGMALTNDGKFHFNSSNGAETLLFTLANTDNQPFTAESLRNSVIRGATFQIEIPKVAHCDQVFNQMIQVAQKMANSLGARMVDDNQKPLGDLQIEKIRQQLKVIHATMVARGIMPGSPSSDRLFN